MASESKTWRNRAGRIALPLVTAVMFVLFTGLIDGNPGVGTDQWLARPGHLIANAMPGLMLASLLLTLTRRTWLSFGVAFLAQGVVFAVSAIKMKNLGTPLLPADFGLVGQLSNGGLSLLSGYLPRAVAPYLAIFALIAVVALLVRFEPPVFARRTYGRRIVATFALGALFATLFAGTPGWAKVYAGQRLGMMPWSPSENAGYNGVVSNLMQFHLQASRNKPKDDPKAALQLIGANDTALREHMAQAAQHTRQPPDIVIIQSESFFDPSSVNGYDDDLAPNLHRLTQEGSGGGLHVPTFGGGTIRTEFEVLTGLSLRYFGNMRYPYLDLHNQVVPSMVRALRSHGYETVALHGHNPNFWNRPAAFQAIGFDRFVSRAGFPANAKNDGTYMADSAMTDEIMAQLPDAGPSRLVFAISIEAHGPYDGSDNTNVAERNAIPVPAGVEGKDKLEWQNYVYHMHHADAELGRLADMLAKRERPTILLFYGDHLPALTNTYEHAGFRDGQPFDTQMVPWVLVDAHNDGPPPVHGDIAAWMLPGLVLERAGIHDDAYFALTQVLGGQLASLTRSPDANTAPEDATVKQTDTAMGNIASLRLKNKLDPLLARYALPDAGIDVARQSGDTEHEAEAGAGQ
jgi:phosphoglycerol transferase MdoB-like AlkP superfamily enzyme